MIEQTTHARGAARVMLVTGASSGIGEAAARRLAREPGASLVLVARREERLRALAATLAPTLGSERVSFIAVDLVDDDAPELIRAHVAEHNGRLDLLVNNAGAAWRRRFDEGGYENVRRTMAINFDAQVRLTEALLPLLRASAPSAIVNVASTAARVTRRAPAPTAPPRRRSRHGRTRCGWRSARTGCMSGWCCRGSSPPRVFPRPS